MSLDGEKNRGSLYALEPDLIVSQKLDGISLSNGLCWSKDRRTFYFIDTGTYEIVSFDYNELTGGIFNRKVIIHVDKKDGAPDGMTIDQEGMLWIAHWDGAQITRRDPSDGRKLLTVPIPVSRPTSCTFGGANLQDLYITTASVGLSGQQLMHQALAGGLLVIKNCGYNGIKNDTFRQKISNEDRL
jgi:sugar lactone lactonase YvrE